MAKVMTQKAAPGLGIDADLARKLLRDMVLIRRFEEKAAEAYALGKIGGFLHLSIGEEAVAAGASSVLRPDDYAISTRSEEHTSELQSRLHPVCRLLLDKKIDAAAAHAPTERQPDDQSAIIRLV